MGKPKRHGTKPKVSKWQRVVVLPIAAKEGRKELSPGQYTHMKDLEKQLVGFGLRRFKSNLRIEPFGEFWELKDKGGILGNKNMRVYFHYDSEANDVIVLMTDKKEDDGAACPAVKYILRNRLRLYRQGYFSGNLIVYTRPEAGI